MPVIHLQPMDSPYATDDEINVANVPAHAIPAPDGKTWRLMQHQVATWQALHSDADIVIDEAFTGDGKSLAAQLPLLADSNFKTSIMYPTNELAKDQKRSLDELFARWKPGKRGAPLYKTLDASVIDSVQALNEDFRSRASVVDALNTPDLLLTNPDILNLVLTFGYQQQGAAKDYLLSRFRARYRLYVFDEFHLFGTPETASVIMTMLLIRQIEESNRPSKFLFLSATPQNGLVNMAQRLGLSVARIKPDYTSGAAHVNSDTHRRILQPVDLHLHVQDGGMEGWIDRNSTLITRFFADHPGAKGVILVNGIATAYRVHDKLQAMCQGTAIRLGAPNTGMTEKSRRTTTADQGVDLFVATSTVDVGVDFRINFLAFESVDQANHFQRLGRLGRHMQAKDGTPFAHFEAHALLPGWVVDGLVSAFSENESVSREVYRDKFVELYPSTQSFNNYNWYWAGVQAGHILKELSSFPIRGVYSSHVDALREHYGKVFGGINNYFRLKKDERHATLNAVRSFRGSSPFQVLVQDQRGQLESGDQERTGLVSYDVIPLLRNGDLLPIDFAEAEQVVNRIDGSGAAWKALKRSRPLAAFSLIGWLDKPREVSVIIDWDVKNDENHDCVIERTGFRFAVAGNSSLNALNNALEERPQAAYLLLDKDPVSVRRMYKLGLSINLFPFHSANSQTGTIAFGRDALLLDSVRRGRKQSKEPQGAIFC